jgi:lysophospholipase L1-like esterase
MVYIGTNDWGCGTYYERSQEMRNFGRAYRAMIEKIKARYEKAEVWCFSLNESYVSEYPSVEFYYAVGDVHIEYYNKIIKDLANEFGCLYVDVYSRHIPYDTKDGAHPNYDGMKTLARLSIEEIEKGLFDR